jgi:hypothetical protein
MTPAREKGASVVRALVIAAIVGSILFGLFIGYLAYTNDSFPTRVMPFDQYATVTSTQFNGTELAFSVTWNNSGYLPYQAQVTSDSSDAANTPVCGLQLQSVTDGQMIFMPFSIASPSAALADVQLSIAVKNVVNGTEFTIAYTVPTITAGNGNVEPSNLTCQQPPGIE